MKKIVRTVWISLLSGLAFLVACTSPKGLTRAEKKQLKEERTAIITQIGQHRQDSEGVNDPEVVLGYRNSEYSLRERLSEINSRLGDSEAQAENGEKMGIILSEMDSLRGIIDMQNIVAPLYACPTVDPRAELRNRLEELQNAIQRREGACVYGSPEVIQRYGEETNRLRQEAAEIQRQLNELENNGEDPGQRVKE